MDYSLHYYDVVLGAIAVAVGLGAVVGVATPVPLVSAVVVSGVVAVALIGHAMFVNGPVDEPADLTEEFEGLD